MTAPTLSRRAIAWLLLFMVAFYSSAVALAFVAFWPQ